MEPYIEATESEIEATFTEWMRRYKEDPSKFLSDQESAGRSAETYGESCTPYFLEILAEVQSR